MSNKLIAAFKTVSHTNVVIFHTILIICLANNGMQNCYRQFSVLFPEFVAGKNVVTK